MGDFALQVKVNRDVFFRFKRLCQSHGIGLSRGVEELMRAALERAGVQNSDVGKETQKK